MSNPETKYTVERANAEVRAHAALCMDGHVAVSYTHLTLPTT